MSCCNDSGGPLTDLNQVFSLFVAPGHVYGLTISARFDHTCKFFLMMGRDVFLDSRVTTF